MYEFSFGYENGTYVLYACAAGYTILRFGENANIDKMKATVAALNAGADALETLAMHGGMYLYRAGREWVLSTCFPYVPECDELPREERG